MDDATISIAIYLKVKDAEICGGDGSTGWAATIVDIYSSDRPGIISRTVQDFKRKMAKYFHIPLKKIKQISREEYEAFADIRKGVTNNENGNEGRSDPYQRS